MKRINCLFCDPLLKLERKEYANAKPCPDCKNKFIDDVFFYAACGHKGFIDRKKLRIYSNLDIGSIGCIILLPKCTICKSLNELNLDESDYD